MQHQIHAGQVVSYGTGRHFNLLGHSITVVLPQDATNGNHYVFEVMTPPGLGLPPHVHQHEDEMIHVLEGEFGILLGEQLSTVKAGDTVYFSQGVPHAFQHVGGKRARTLHSCSGSGFRSLLRQAGRTSPKPAGHAPDH